MVETPPELAFEFQAMLNRASPKRPLTLICRNRVDRVGQWTPDGVVVLGLDDIRERAQLLERTLRVRQAHGHWSRPVPDLDTLDKFAQRQVLAHELGHELDRQEKRPSQFAHPEAAADYWAGWLEGQRPGSDEELGAAFFSLIGCNTEGCTYPRSSERATAYRAGFAAGQKIVERANSRQTTDYVPPRVSPPPPQSSGPSLGEAILTVGAIGVGTVGLAYGVGKLLEAIFEDSKPARQYSSRSRSRRGGSKRG